MQKVYLLLRNNQQSGPYSLEEILQIGLKPFDLVWVDGKSAAWQYPAEVPALTSYVDAPPQPENPYQPISTALMEEEKPVRPNRVFVSMPKKERMEVAAPVPATSFFIPEEPLVKDADLVQKPSWSGTREEKILEEPTTSPKDDSNYQPVSYQGYFSKKKTKNKGNLLPAAALVIVIAGGYFFLVQPRTPHKQKTVSILPVNGSQPQAVPEPVSNLQEEQPAAPSRIENNQKPLQRSDKVKGKNNTVAKQPVQLQQQAEQTVPAPFVHDKTEERAAEPSAVSEPGVETAKSGNTKSGKKKAGDLIRSIFSRQDKKKTETSSTGAVVTDDPPPATDRKAVRRSDQGPAAEQQPQEENETSGPDLATLVDLGSNAPDNWMMGVSGLKITLKNRSSLVLASATVEVDYYDANNHLLDKKLIYFSNVPAKGKMTLAAPDNKWADHTEMKLAAVRAKDDRYARKE